MQLREREGLGKEVEDILKLPCTAAKRRKRRCDDARMVKGESAALLDGERGLAEAAALLLQHRPQTDVAVVERQDKVAAVLLREVHVEPLRVGGVVARLKAKLFLADDRHERVGNDPAARVAVRLAEQSHRHQRSRSDRGFLLRLTQRTLLDRFVRVQKAARKRPVILKGVSAAANQQQRQLVAGIAAVVAAFLCANRESDNVRRQRRTRIIVLTVGAQKFLFRGHGIISFCFYHLNNITLILSCQAFLAKKFGRTTHTQITII